MKKFLFTLAALMMAGSLFAEEYAYIDNFEVTQDQLGTNITVDVKAHADYAVTSMQVDMVFPQGLTLRKISKGADLNFTYFDDFGDEWDAEQTIFVGAVSTTNFAWATADQGYYEVDGEWLPYGAVKLMPGDYNQIAQLTIRVDAAFTGGEIVVETQPSCGTDPRPDVTPCPAGQDNFKTTVVTVEGGQTGPEDFVGTADVTFTDNVATISYTSNDPNATVEVTLNGQPLNVTFENGVATWAAPTAAEQTVAGDYTYTVAIKVTPDGENFVGDPVSDSDTYSYTVEQTDEPVINIIHQDAAHAYFTVEGAGEVVVTVNGQPATPATYNGVACYVVYAVEGEPVTYEVTATAKEEGKLISDEASKTIEFAAWDGVEELVNGKAVAGVRYFNMAGQEMQQANGVTIVVTTYTDGTTSAVKVMK